MYSSLFNFRKIKYNEMCFIYKLVYLLFLMKLINKIIILKGRKQKHQKLQKKKQRENYGKKHKNVIEKHKLINF